MAEAAILLNVQIRTWSTIFKTVLLYCWDIWTQNKMKMCRFRFQAYEIGTHTQTHTIKNTQRSVYFCLSICLSVRLYIWLSFYPYICLLTVCMSVYLFTCLSVFVFLYVSLSIYLYICLFVCLYVCMSVRPSVCLRNIHQYTV